MFVMLLREAWVLSQGEADMNPTKQMARKVGLLYLGMVLSGPFSLIYVPGKVIVPGNAAATSANVLAHETLFRAGIAGTLIGNLVFLLLAFALYRLFSGVNKLQKEHEVPD